jgi:hypothetical protein
MIIMGDLPLESSFSVARQWSKISTIFVPFPARGKCQNSNMNFFVISKSNDVNPQLER